MVFRDQLLNVYEEVNSGTPGYNPIWYRVWGGFVHRARMQKVQYIYNSVASEIRKNGQLAEVTVPFTQALRPVGKSWQPLNRLYYSSVHWVKAVENGPDGLPWYTVLDELLDITYSVPASHLRLIPDEEIAPISPEVPFEKKRIEVSLSGQRVTCFENDQSVFTTLVSSGRINNNPGPNGIPTTTPSGKFRINVKMPSKHMGSGDLASAADIGAYQLPGVPWTTFIQFQDRPFQGHAFHGTYWHDNFGVPMSSGCLNMRTEEAKWLFRWCLPAAPANEIDPLTLDKKGYGTPGIITP
jgi:lipoprotein-anchoring transpeptidase ErfK/SrfK